MKDGRISRFSNGLMRRMAVRSWQNSLLRDGTHLHLFVGEAMNPAHQAAGLPFDLSVRMRLVDKIVEEGRKMGKTVSVKYY